MQLSKILCIWLPPVHLGAAERSYPTSKVRGRSWEDPMPKGSGQEELTKVQGQGQWPRVSGCDSAGAAERSYPTPDARDSGWEEQPHIQGAVAVQAQEGLAELFHVQGHEGQQ